jgi:hypothetical protein
MIDGPRFDRLVQMNDRFGMASRVPYSPEVDSQRDPTFNITSRQYLKEVLGTYD